VDVGVDGMDNAAKLTSKGFVHGGTAAVQGRHRWLTRADLFSTYMRKPGSDSLLPELETHLPWHSRQGEAFSALVAAEQVGQRWQQEQERKRGCQWSALGGTGR
jgi:hypothetical protein